MIQDARRLRYITPGKRGWRFVSGCIKGNTPYLIVTAADVTISKHYTASGCLKRLRVLIAAGLKVRALEWTGAGWQTLAARRPRRHNSCCDEASQPRL